MTLHLELNDAINYMASLQDNAVTLTITDIPYGVINREGGIRNMDKGDADILTFNLHDFIYANSCTC